MLPRRPRVQDSSLRPTWCTTRGCFGLWWRPFTRWLWAVWLRWRSRTGGRNADAVAAAAAAAEVDGDGDGGADDGIDGNDRCETRCSLDAAAAAPPPAHDAAEVVLAYRLRTEPKSAEHFWHLLASRFEVAPPVGDGVLEAALSAWGMDRSPLEGGVSVYHLVPRPRDAASRRGVCCLYCQRVLMPQPRERQRSLASESS